MLNNFLLIFLLCRMLLTDSAFVKNVKFNENPMDNFIPKDMKPREKPSLITQHDNKFMLLPWYKTNFKVLCNPRPLCKKNEDENMLRCSRYCSHCRIHWQPKRNLNTPEEKITYYIRKKYCSSCYVRFTCEPNDLSCQKDNRTCDPNP